MHHSSMMAAGVDVSKSKLDVGVTGQKHTFTVPNSKPGWEDMVLALKEAGVSRVGLEATGGYERGAADHLRQAGFDVAILQPIQVRAFAKARLQRAKNDRLDAQLIAAFTALADHRATAPDERLVALAHNLAFLEQTEEDIARFKTRLEHTTDERLRAIIQADIKQLATRKTQELANLLAALRAHADLAKRLDLLVSIRGLGERTAVTLVIRMPELGHVTREQAAALAGLCPYDDDTGQYKGERHIQGGRVRLRSALYKAAVPAASHWNPALVAFRQRLKSKHKPEKLIFVACARKLLIQANAVLARQTPWTPTPP